MIGGVVIEPEGPGQGLEHLLGGSVVAALLEPHVVVGADPGQHRDFLAAKPQHATPSLAREAYVSWFEPLTASPEELSQLLGAVHPRDRNAWRTQGSPDIPRKARALASPSSTLHARQQSCTSTFVKGSPAATLAGLAKR